MYIQYTPALLHLSAARDRIAANLQRQCEFNRRRRRRCGGSSKILSGSGETLSDERQVAAGDIDLGFESRMPEHYNRRIVWYLRCAEKYYNDYVSVVCYRLE